MRKRIVMVAAGLALAACSTQPSHDLAARRAAYEAAAGQPVRDFHYFSLYSWEPLGETGLAVYATPRRAWLLDLDGPCPDLAFSDAIGLTSNDGNVSARFDRVLPGRGRVSCGIATIRPIDVGRLRDVEARQRQIHEEPRAAGATPAPGG